MIQNVYFKIKGHKLEDNINIFSVSLIQDCEVYKGHFPNKAVSPGVCNIEMIKECAEIIIGKPLLLNYIKQCKLKSLMLPTEHQNFDIKLEIKELENAYTIIASIYNSETIFMELKGEAKSLE